MCLTITLSFCLCRTSFMSDFTTWFCSLSQADTEARYWWPMVIMLTFRNKNPFFQNTFSWVFINIFAPIATYCRRHPSAEQWLLPKRQTMKQTWLSFSPCHQCLSSSTDQFISLRQTYSRPEWFWSCGKSILLPEGLNKDATICRMDRKGNELWVSRVMSQTIVCRQPMNKEHHSLSGFIQST